MPDLFQISLVIVPMDGTWSRFAAGRAQATKNGQGQHRGDRDYSRRAARKSSPKSQNVAVLHPDVDVMSGIRDALCPTVFSTELQACPSTGQGSFSRGAQFVPGPGFFAPPLDHGQKVSLRTQHRQTKPARLPGKIRSMPPHLPGQALRTVGGTSLSDEAMHSVASLALDAAELDILEQTLHGEGEIVQKYPPPECSMFHALDSLNQAVEEPDRFFGDFMGHGAIPPVDLEDMDKMTDDRMGACDDVGLICNDVANPEGGADAEDFSRTDFPNYTLSVDAECKPEQPHSFNRQCQSAKVSGREFGHTSLHSSGNFESKCEHQRNSYNGIVFPHVNEVTQACRVADTNHKSEEADLFRENNKSLQTGLDSPVSIQDAAVSLESSSLKDAHSLQKLMSKTDQSFATVCAEYGVAFSSFPKHNRAMFRTFQAGKRSPICAKEVSKEGSLKRKIDFADPSTESCRQAEQAQASRLSQHGRCLPAYTPEHMGELSEEIRAKIDALRAKIVTMPRRKLRECLAKGVTLEEIEPLMVVNRDDLAAMLSLGVTTWKSFLHQELGVSRWPARALKSIANKTSEAKARLEEAQSDCVTDEALSIRLDIERLSEQKRELMQQLRAEASQYKLDAMNARTWNLELQGKRRRI